MKFKCTITISSDRGDRERESQREIYREREIERGILGIEILIAKFGEWKMNYGDTFPEMDLMRSEKMSFVQLIIPVESAHRAITYLGELGLLQFRDVCFLFPIHCIAHNKVVIVFAVRISTSLLHCLGYFVIVCDYL